MTSCWPLSRRPTVTRPRRRSWPRIRSRRACASGRLSGAGPPPLDDLPPEPDADLETVRELATRVKAALALDQRRTIFAERQAAEAHLLETIEQTLAQPDLPDPARALLRDLRAAATRARDHLAAPADTP
jgi:hypothetical protein